ncbi:uncharacterized protein VTP21DRAFT_2162 [Calcarisporiella thermophila]|uniref:uncharacterized protein n=1 Tax=Calcarisporiella thermophila TaxID=911321 RepID=UPI0037425565
MSSRSDKETLIEMGFPQSKVERALRETKGAGLQPAMDWLIAHAEDPEDAEDTPMGSADAAQGSTSEMNVDESKNEANEENEEGEVQPSELTAQSLMCSDCQKLFRDASAAERHAIKTGHTNFAESTTAIKPLTAEEKEKKLAELRAKLAEKRAVRQTQEEEERRQQEKIRRKTGKELSEAREKFKEKEMEKALEERKREKEEDRLAKERVKAQIEADRRERQMKREQAKAQQQAPQAPPVRATAPAAPTSSKDYKEARLQIRLPPGGGNPLTQTFCADAPLREVYQWVESHCPPPFKLSTTFPRRVLEGADLEKSLRDLGLVPSAVLVVSR